MEVKSMLKIPKNIARDPRLSPGSRLIYGELMDFGEISVDELTVIYKISKKTLIRRINQLVKYGYIQYEYICKKLPKLMIIKSGQNCPKIGTKLSQNEDKNVPKLGQKCPKTGTKLSQNEFVEKEEKEKEEKEKEKEREEKEKEREEKSSKKEEKEKEREEKEKEKEKKEKEREENEKEKVGKKKSNEKIKMKDDKIESGIGDQNVNSDYEHVSAPNFDENASKVKLPSEEKKIEKNGVRIKKKEMELINLVNQYTKNTDLVLSILEFIRMRSVIKKPLTKHALELSLRKLDSLSTDDEIKKQIVDRSIEMCWLSFFPLPSPAWKTKENSDKTKENNDNNSYVIE